MLFFYIKNETAEKVIMYFDFVDLQSDNGMKRKNQKIFLNKWWWREKK